MAVPPRYFPIELERRVNSYGRRPSGLCRTKCRSARRGVVASSGASALSMRRGRRTPPPRPRGRRHPRIPPSGATSSPGRSLRRGVTRAWRAIRRRSPMGVARLAPWTTGSRRTLRATRPTSRSRERGRTRRTVRCSHTTPWCRPWTRGSLTAPLSRSVRQRRGQREEAVLRGALPRLQLRQPSRAREGRPRHLPQLPGAGVARR